MTARVTVTVDVHEDHLVVHWESRSGQGSCRFDRLPGAVPEWLGAADELFDGASRRDEDQILDAIARHESLAGRQLGLWHDDDGVELV